MRSRGALASAMWRCAVVVWAAWSGGALAADSCALRPPAVPGLGDRRPGDNHYRLVIGEVDKYVPKAHYIVTLVGMRTHEVVQQFTKFKLIAESENASLPRTNQGMFQLFADTTSKFDEECLNTVVEANEWPKTEVQVLWWAPAAGSGCVLLKAMVYENASSWFAEDGQLTKRICENTTVAESDCCACDDAKYRMTFEGLWSAETHPKDFPVQALWLTHFSDVIGATHPKNFSFWGVGQIATDGFRSLAEWGSVDLLERELRQKDTLLRSIIKAEGLWYPKVNSNTSALFSVDRKRHLVSLASMFGPSPDWVVGVSGLDLCLKNCTWVESKVVDLLPYDAGTDDGISYLSPNVETVPRSRMYRITPMYPEDPRAPFYDPEAQEVPPLARLYLKREKIMPRGCDEKTLQSLVAAEEDDKLSVNKLECSVSAWGPWSACSVSCGKGLRMRTRAYVTADKAQAAGCARQLVSKEMCVAAVPECEHSNVPADDKDEESPMENSVCSTTEWGAWSECSVTCGVGVSTRRRHFHHHMGIKKCPLVSTEENRKCMEPPCTESEKEEWDPSCPTSPWAAWSPCSATCGRGVRFRTRLLLVPPQQQQRCSARVELLQQRPCLQREDCSVDMPTAKRICMEAPAEGPCRGLYRRWAFVAAKGMCVPFNYGGCRGNGNNFLTQDECFNTCSFMLGGRFVPTPRAPQSQVQQPIVSSNYPGLSISSIIPVTPANVEVSGEADCQLSPLGEWSPCSVSCGMGYQERNRVILKEAGPGGKPCPRRLKVRRRCNKRC